MKCTDLQLWQKKLNGLHWFYIRSIYIKMTQIKCCKHNLIADKLMQRNCIITNVSKGYDWCFWTWMLFVSFLIELTVGGWRNLFVLQITWKVNVHRVGLSVSISVWKFTKLQATVWYLCKQMHQSLIMNI